MLDFGAVDDLRQQSAALRQAEGLDHHVIILTIAEIAEGEACFRRIGGANAGEIEIEPVLAVKGCFRIVQKLRRGGVHMRHLRALLAGIESGAGRFKARAVHGPGGKPRDGRGGAGIEPQPGIADRLVAVADKPGSVALSGDGNRRGAFGKARQLGAKIAQGASAILPCLGKRLGNRAMVAGIVFVANRRGFDLASAEVESDCLEHGRARVDPDDDVTCLTHGGYLPSLTFGFLPRLKIHRSRPRL